MTTMSRSFTPIWPSVEPHIIAAQPNSRMPRPNDDGWIGGLRSPLRKEKNPSFSVKPDTPTDPGAFMDHGSGENGSISKLAQLLGIDPRVSSIKDANEPQTFSTFCSTRKLDPDIVANEWGAKQTLWKGRPALRYPTVLGIDRIKYLGGKGDKYTWAEMGGRRHWYGFKQAQQHDGTIYMVNGEPSVWACHQEGVAAICLCGGEGAAPTPELVTELRDAGITSVRVVYDLDDKGRTGAPRTVAVLRAGGVDADAYELPAFIGEKGDVDDLHRWVGTDLAVALANLPKIADDTMVSTPVRKLLHVSELHTLPKPEDIIPGVLSKNKLNLIYGPPGAGKSHINLDMSLSVSQKAPVIYLAGEDVEEYLPRIEAWCKQHNADPGQLYFWPEPVNLLNPDSVAAFLDEVKPIGPVAIVIDTLATCMTGADENSTRDMTIAIEALHYIRRQTEAGLLICHHTGWSDTHERGSSALRGSIRMAMKVSQNDDGLISLTCEKANNSAGFDPRYFRLTPQGESVALIPSSKMTGRDAPLKQQHYDLLEALNLSVFADGASFSQLVDHTGLAKSTVNRALSKLLERDYLTTSEGRSKVYSLTVSGRHELNTYLFHSADASSTQVPGGSPDDPELNLNWVVTMPSAAPSNDVPPADRKVELGWNSTGTTASIKEEGSTVVPPSSSSVPPSSTVVPFSRPNASEFRSSSPPYKGGTWNSGGVETTSETPVEPSKDHDQQTAFEVDCLVRAGKLDEAKTMANKINDHALWNVSMDMIDEAHGHEQQGGSA